MKSGNGNVDVDVDADADADVHVHIHLHVHRSREPGGVIGNAIPGLRDQESMYSNTNNN